MYLASIFCKVECHLDRVRGTIAVYEYFVGEKISDSFVVECHQTLEKDYVGWADISGLLHSGMFDERVDRDRYRFVGFDQIHKGFVGQVEVKCIGVVEVVLGDIDFRFVHILMAKEILL